MCRLCEKRSLVWLLAALCAGVVLPAVPSAGAGADEAALQEALGAIDAVEQLLRQREALIAEKKTEILRLGAEWGLGPAARNAAARPEGERWGGQLAREIAAYAEAMDERIAALRGARLALGFHRGRLRDELLRLRTLNAAPSEGFLAALSAELEACRRLVAEPIRRGPVLAPGS